VIGDRKVGVCFTNSGRTCVSTFVFVVPLVLLTSAGTLWFVYTVHSSSRRTSRADCRVLFTSVSQTKNLIFVTS
jgi:hypothetical protein